jgi:MOSC domain-containing protein YiiM
VTTLEEVRRSPREAGTVELVARRVGPGEREVLAEAQLDLVGGLVGDSWSTEDSPDPAAQLTLMNARSAAMIAGARDRWPLAGDQLYVDLDLSTSNVSPGSRLSVGTAVVEITPEPHLGCGKFVRRFGVDAMKLVNSAVGRELRLRGVNARIIAGGVVRPGDEIRLLAPYLSGAFPSLTSPVS